MSFSNATLQHSMLNPNYREIMTGIFLSSTATLSTKSVVFVAWGQLLTYDLSLTIDNGSEPFDIACDDGGGVPDVWCPLGTNSEDISFNRSNAAVSNSSTRDPINYATSFIDLDYMYGRSEETAKRFRTLEGGFMNVTERGIPFRNADGTWMVSRVAHHEMKNPCSLMFTRTENIRGETPIIW